jgi:RecA-family ATPase
MRTVRIRKFLQEQDDVSWLIDTLLPDIGWTLLYGLRGVGKTTFALQMCDALQRGEPFMGLATKQTNILYIQADSVTAEWRYMMSRIAPQCDDGFTTIDVPSQCLSTPEYVASLCKAVQTFDPGFVVFDSLYRLTRESINTERVQVALNIMGDIVQGRPWLLIHHPPHGESRAAGHHSIGGTCSNEWSLLKTKLKIEKGRLVKAKEIPLSKDEDGLWIPYARSGYIAYADDGLYNRDIV